MLAFRAPRASPLGRQWGTAALGERWCGIAIRDVLEGCRAFSYGMEVVQGLLAFAKAREATLRAVVFEISNSCRSSDACFHDSLAAGLLELAGSAGPSGRDAARAAHLRQLRALVRRPRLREMQGRGLADWFLMNMDQQSISFEDHFPIL